MHHNHNMIRQETPEDYQNVELLTREAFWNVYRPGCIEHYIVHQYRCREDFVPELDFYYGKGRCYYRSYHVCECGNFI